MSITLINKAFLDIPLWRPVSPQPSNAGAASTGPTGGVFTNDQRGRNYGDPNLWRFTNSTTSFQSFNSYNNGWLVRQFSATLGGTAGGGNGWKFVPSQGPSGTITSGATTTSVVLSTALPGSVNANQMANRGDGLGYILRIVDNGSGGSGKCEERRVVANTSGTTPTVYLDTALTFTPVTGSRYEFLSGALYLLTTGAAKEFRRHDILTGVTSAALSTTNLIATVLTTYNDLVPLDEQFVPYTRYPGEGFIIGASIYDTASSTYQKGCLLATAIAAGTITGQASAGDVAVLTNEYRNFQIRIVEDTVNVTAVGQRRRITSHTAGASPVYTLASNWTVTPSANCKFVIEYDTDKILMLTASTTVYNYNIAANTWDTTTWATRGSAAVTGTGSFMAFGIVDTKKVIRNSYLYSYRGTGTGNNPFDILDIAGGSTGVWSSITTTPNVTTTLIAVTDTGAAYDGLTLEGRYIYFIGITALSQPICQVMRFDMKTGDLEPYSPINVTTSNTSVTTCNNLGINTAIDGKSALSVLTVRLPLSVSGQTYQITLIN